MSLLLNTESQSLLWSGFFRNLKTSVANWCLLSGVALWSSFKHLTNGLSYLTLLIIGAVGVLVGVGGGVVGTVDMFDILLVIGFVTLLIQLIAYLIMLKKYFNFFISTFGKGGVEVERMGHRGTLGSLKS